MQMFKYLLFFILFYFKMMKETFWSSSIIKCVLLIIHIHINIILYSITQRLK